MNLLECEDQRGFKVQAVPVFRIGWRKMFREPPENHRSKSAQKWRWLSVLRSGCPLPSRNPGTYFCHRLSWTQEYCATGRIMSAQDKSNNLIGNRTRILPEPTTIPSALLTALKTCNLKLCSLLFAPSWLQRSSSWIQILPLRSNLTFPEHSCTALLPDQQSSVRRMPFAQRVVDSLRCYLTAIWADCPENVGSSTSLLMGPQSMVQKYV
jgi:hypothetical protein